MLFFLQMFKELDSHLGCLAHQHYQFSHLSHSSRHVLEEIKVGKKIKHFQKHFMTHFNDQFKLKCIAQRIFFHSLSQKSRKYIENCTVEISTGQDEHPTQNTSKKIPNLPQNCINILNFLKPRIILANFGFFLFQHLFQLANIGFDCCSPATLPAVVQLVW